MLEAVLATQRDRMPPAVGNAVVRQLRAPLLFVLALFIGMNSLVQRLPLIDWWLPLVGEHGVAMGVDTFGESAPGDEVYRHFGINAENLIKLVKGIL